MDPDKYQQAWQAESSGARVTVNSDLLLKEVERSQREFRATIFGRDVVEVLTAVVMLPTWFVMGYMMSLPWSWYLSVPAMLWVAGFILVDRKRHPRKPIDGDKPLRESALESLNEVEHQIWLLRSVFWWYLLPYTIPMLAFFAHVSWSSRSAGWVGALILFVLAAGFLFAVYFFIYKLNQRAVRASLEPRRQELVALLTSLGDETTGEVIGQYPILVNTKRVEVSRRRFVVTILFAIVCFVVLLSIGLGIIYFASRW